MTATDIEVPEHQKWILNLSELKEFASEVRQTHSMHRFAQEIDGNMLRRYGNRTPDVVPGDFDVVRCIKQTLINKWFEEVAKPQLERHFKHFCVPIKWMDPHERNLDGGSWWNPASLHATLDPQSDKKIAVTLEVTDTTNPVYEFMENTRTFPSLRGLRGMWTATMRVPDVVRIKRARAELPREATQSAASAWKLTLKEVPEMWYFCGQFANEKLASITDWLISSEGDIPRNVTKLSLLQACVEADKWHKRLEKRKKKEAETKLKTASRGLRTLIGCIKVQNVKTASGKKEDTLSVWWLRDEDALKYESMMQHHCVDGYWPYVQSGSMVILHVESLYSGNWTVELAGDNFSVGAYRAKFLNTVVQMKGPCNVEAPVNIRQAVEFFLNALQIIFTASGKTYVGHESLIYTYINAHTEVLTTKHMSATVVRNSEHRFNGKPYVSELAVNVPSLDLTARALHTPKIYTLEETPRTFTIAGEPLTEPSLS